MATQEGKPKAAAFFDLDRTLVADSSGLILVDALVDLGLLREHDRLLARLTRSAYRRVGETWIGMQLTRRSVGRLAGWSVDQLRQAAQRALDALDRAVFDEARALIERHRAEGRLVVLATSTGREIVEPLAQRLRFDHVIATEYEEQGGILTGNFLGAWLWGPDKAKAVRRWAEEEGVDLEESYAYSDSYFDLPLLRMVGYPRPVNPDPLLRAAAARHGWPVLRFRNAGGGTSLGDLELYDVLRVFLHPLLLPFDLKAEGLEHIPRAGAVIVAANHRSYLDPAVLSAVASRRGRKLRYLGKREVFDAPVVGQVARALRQIPVDRGTGQARPLREALDALSRGEAIGIFPQGTIPRGEAFFEPRLQGKTGVARLAVASGAPVVPVALWGTERIWPRAHRVPRPTLGKRPVWARVGEPLYLKAPGGGEEEPEVLARLTQEVMDAISALLPEEVRNPPPPTPEQVRLATPPGGERVRP